MILHYFDLLRSYHLHRDNNGGKGGWAGLGPLPPLHGSVFVISTSPPSGDAVSS